MSIGKVTVTHSIRGYKQYAWRAAGNCRGNNPLLPQSLRRLFIGKSGCGKTSDL